MANASLANATRLSGHHGEGVDDLKLAIHAFFFVASLGAMLLVFWWQMKLQRPPPRPSRQPERADADDRAAECKAALVAVENDVASSCVICLGNDADDLVRPPGCAHVFHRSCLYEWIDQIHRIKSSAVARPLTCPVCTLPIVRDTTTKPT